MSDFNVAPSTFDQSSFDAVMVPYLDLARGLGVVLADYSLEHGWSPSAFFDHDGGAVILDAAMKALSEYAKANQLFYNRIKLEDAASLALANALRNAFDRARLTAG